MSSLDYLDLCRLCLVKDRVSVPIFEDEGDVRQIFLKITACLPVKVMHRCQAAAIFANVRVVRDREPLVLSLYLRFLLLL